MLILLRAQSCFYYLMHFGHRHFLQLRTLTFVCLGLRAAMANMSIVDTSASGLLLFGAFPRAMLADVTCDFSLEPKHVMLASESRAWVPLYTKSEAAVDRVPWMCRELGIPFNGSADVLVVKVEFTALGFGHYHLRDMLTTRDWKHWRFHGPLQSVGCNQDGQVLHRIDPEVMMLCSADSSVP